MGHILELTADQMNQSLWWRVSDSHMGLLSPENFTSLPNSSLSPQALPSTIVAFLHPDVFAQKMDLYSISQIRDS